MSALGPFMCSNEGSRVAFYCPGCKHHHSIPVAPGDGPRWTLGTPDKPFDENSPTIQPSLKITVGDNTICHVVVTDGKLYFCEDSSHELSGQTVSMVPIP